MEMIEIPKEKAIEIVILFMEKNSFYYDKVEKVFLKKGIISDIVSHDEMVASLRNCSKEILVLLMEII